MMVPDVPRARPSAREQLRLDLQAEGINWTPHPPHRHVPGLPKPEPRPGLTVREAMGSVPIGTK